MAAIGTGIGDDFGTCKYCGADTFNGCCLKECANSCGEVPGTDATHGDSCDCQACSDAPMDGWNEDTQTWGDSVALVFSGFHTCPTCGYRVVEGNDDAKQCATCDATSTMSPEVPCDGCNLGKVIVAYMGGTGAQFKYAVYCDDCESWQYRNRLAEDGEDSE